MKNRKQFPNGMSEADKKELQRLFIEAAQETAKEIKAFNARKEEMKNVHI